MKRKFLAVIGTLAMLMGVLPGSVLAQATAPAQVVVPVPGPALTVKLDDGSQYLANFQFK